MKSYQEIKDIIVKDLGITNLEEYRRYCDLFKDDTRKLLKEELELLSPDNINNKDFWIVAEQLFGIDPVCNTKSGVKNIEEGNVANLKLARHSGMLNFVEDNSDLPIEILEIGPGYGSLKNYIKSKTKFLYKGVDVYPKCDEIIASNIDGTLPEEIKTKKFGHVVSSNVFQHLSIKQRRQYYSDISNILLPGGAFLFNNMCYPKSGQWRGYVDSKGDRYLSHYGQWTLIQTLDEIIEELKIYFDICITTLLNPNQDFVGFYCVNKKKNNNYI
jgi:SAM-dependent methyltransferase